MDKKKKIYIAVIVGCFLLSGGILYYSFGSGGSAEPVATVPESAAVGQAGQAPSLSGYRAPSVFPVETKFDTSVFESSKYKTLRDGKALTVENTEVGRDNPFAKY